jgi:hypothetical protein
MKHQSSHPDLIPIVTLASVASRGAQHSASSYGEVTRRQKKHDMLITFMANAKAEKRKPAPVKPRLLTALLSIFF